MAGTSQPNAEDLDEVHRIIEPMLGLPAWAPSLGYASFLTVEFGAAEERRPRRSEPYFQGEWHLWIYCASWRLETATAVIAASNDTREVMNAAASSLDGRALEAVEIAKPSLETTFRFDGGHSLWVFPIYSGAGKDDPEHWMLFTPGHMVLSVGPGVTWSYQRSDEPAARSVRRQAPLLSPEPPSIEEALASLEELVDAWCERRALVPLGHLLPAFSAPLAHTDQFGDLRTAVQNAMAFGRDELQGDEEDRLADVIAAIDVYVRARIGTA